MGKLLGHSLIVLIECRMLSCFNEKFLDDHSFGQLQEAFKNRNIAQFISNFQVYISKIINNDDNSPFFY